MHKKHNKLSFYKTALFHIYLLNIFQFYNGIELIVKLTINCMFSWVSKVDWLCVIRIH